MTQVPRLAVGTVAPGTDAQAVMLAFLVSLRRLGLDVQCFLSQARFPRNQAAAVATGLRVRQLDSWLMTRGTCLDAFVRGSESADLAVVEGSFADHDGGGRMDTLCEWLDLPRLAVLDASRMAHCVPLGLPPSLDGLLLDRVDDDRRLARLMVDLEALADVPVLGAVSTAHDLRRRLAVVPPGGPVPARLVEQFGAQSARWFDTERLAALASRRPLPCRCRRSCRPRTAARRLTVAVAYDEAFNCYFSDTLELFELHGANVVAFSPLRDEGIPSDTDVVYLGCGHPERFAAELAENHCMKSALRNHVRMGRRMYAEGGGAAYLSQQMETPGGSFYRMTGILPAVARLLAAPTCVEPVEVAVAAPNWLAPVGARLRGYRNPIWRFEPLGPLTELSGRAGGQYDLMSCSHAVASSLHLCLAAHPALMDHFLRAQDRPLTVDPWTVSQ